MRMSVKKLHINSKWIRDAVRDKDVAKSEQLKDTYPQILCITWRIYTELAFMVYVPGCMW